MTIHDWFSLGLLLFVVFLIMFFFWSGLLWLQDLIESLKTWKQK